VGFYFNLKLKRSHMEFCFLGFVYFLVFFEFFLLKFNFLHITHGVLFSGFWLFS